MKIEKIKNSDYPKTLQAKDVLRFLGLPNAQQNEISTLTLLTLCGITEKDKWENSKRVSLTLTKDIMSFVNKNYKKKLPYAPNSRESFRRQVLHQFEQAGIIDKNPDNPSLPINSAKTHYAITKEALIVIKSFGKKDWNDKLKNFKSKVGDLNKKYRNERYKLLVPIKFSNGQEVNLSPGKHNEVKASVIQKFCPRFAENAIVLYLGDTANKSIYLDVNILKKLNIPFDKHAKLPDIILYDEAKKWIYLIEVVTSHGPVSPKRLIELENLLISCKTAKIYITVFPDRKEFKKHFDNIAWETEVWIAEEDSHMIHFNGDKFFGPYV